MGAHTAITGSTTVGLVGTQLAAGARNWRFDGPETGHRIGPGAAIFHDGVATPITISDRRRGVLISVEQFDGAYVSVAFDLQHDVCMRLRTGWRLVVSVLAEVSRPIATYLRLNLSHPRNVDVLCELAMLDCGSRSLVFDLDRVPVAPDAAWLDVLFHYPDTAEIWLGEVSLDFEEL